MRGMFSRDVTLGFKFVPKYWGHHDFKGCGEPCSQGQGGHRSCGFPGTPLVAAKNVGNATVAGETDETWGACESLAIAHSRDRFRRLSGCSRQPDGAAHPRARQIIKQGWRASASRSTLRSCQFILREPRKNSKTSRGTLHPDAILHFGLAARRKYLSVETRALNRVSLLHSDTSGARASCRVIVAGAVHSKRATFPARQIEAALRRAGFHARLSVNAGDYVCNEMLYLSLSRSQARAIGFIPCAAARTP